MLGYNASSIRDWEVFKIKRREGQTGNITGRLEKVTQLIDKVVDGLARLNDEEGVWFGWFVGEGDAQIIRGRCPIWGVSFVGQPKCIERQ